MAEVVRAARKRDFLRDRIIQLTFGTFVATFTYAMILQRSVRGTTGGQHPARPARLTGTPRARSRLRRR